MASPILDDLMVVNFFTAASIKQQEFDFNNLNKSKKLIFQLKYIIYD